MTGVDHSAARAFAHCRDVTRSRARNFFYGLRLLPEPKRSALYAIYAWMREADDIVDDGRPHELEAFERSTADVLSGGTPPPGPLWTALAATASAWDLELQPFLDMIRGQRFDQDGQPVQTEDDLFEYCRRVASTVGLICIRIWGHVDPAAPALAVDRGIAFQLTNILRDLGEDLSRGRCYLPADQMKDCGIDAGDLASWRPSDRCHHLVRGWIEVAREHYERSRPLDAMIDSDSRPALWAMTTTYSTLLSRIAAAPRRSVLGRRIRLSAARKAGIAVRARFGILRWDRT